MIKATFPEGVSAMTVNGLYQWDYGQTLQIEAADLPALVEVHFACDGMKEAFVRSCSAAGGVVTAAIPDLCLEQTSPVIAWVYEVGSTSGKTTKTVTLPVIARARPEPSAPIPTATSDKYTEAVAAMNAAVESLSAGDVKVNAAKEADEAALADNLVVKALASGTDLNTVTSPGRYSLVADDSYTNAIMANTVRYLDVIKQGNYIWQIITGSAYQGANWHPFRTYQRCYSINSVEGEASTTYGWTSWYENINTYNLGRQTVKNAENANTAASIKPSRTGSVTVSNAGGTMQSALANNTIYLVVLKGTNSGTGKVWADSGTFLHTTSSASHGVRVGEYYIEITDTSIIVDNLDIAPATATVTFYALGSV